MKHLSLVALAALVVVAPLAGCAREDASPQSIRVLAAASLVDVLKPMVAAYRQANPGAKVQVDTGASSALVQKLRSGAKADVLITADEATMSKAVAGESRAIRGWSRRTAWSSSCRRAIRAR